jgi:hypothetical protein
MSQPFTISLDSLLQPVDFDAMREAATSDGCSSSSCGSSAKPEDLDASTWERIKDHPCYSEEAHHYFARMHRGRAGVQHPVQLLQSQIRLRQREPTRRRVGEADAG